MVVTPGELDGLLVIDTRRFGDDRGWFFESWNSARYRQAGLDAEFVQDNVSFSTRGVLRGLHFQNPDPQGKLVFVITGEVWDVAVDLRTDSPTFGRWEAYTLSAANGRQLFVPEGFAHGFVVLSDNAVFGYKCTRHYRPDAERTLRWDDPSVGITWPVAAPILSSKDREGKSLEELAGDLGR